MELYKSRADKKTSVAEAGSEEAFITEHWGYTKVSNNKTYEYHVSHPVWNIHKVLAYDVQCNTRKLYGMAFEEYLTKYHHPLCHSPVLLVKYSALETA